MFRLLTIILVLSSTTLKSQTSFGVEQEEDSIACGGVERWAQKVLMDSLSKTINFNPIEITVEDFVNLTTPNPSTSMKRFAGVEDKTYKIIANITIKKEESDNDIHLVLSYGTNTLIAEIPDPDCPDAKASLYASDYKTAHEFVEKNIGPGNMKNLVLPLFEVTGVAFIDSPHGQTGAAPNHLELHPILNIKFYTPTATDQIAKEEIKVYPNPFIESTHISIESPNNLQDSRFVLLDLYGKIISVHPLVPEDSHHIELKLSREGLEAGMYIYGIISQGQTVYTGKLIAL